MAMSALASVRRSMLEIESIKQTRTLGARHLDAGDWDALLEPFSDDAVFDAGPMGLDAYSGKDALREFFGPPQLEGY